MRSYPRHLARVLLVSIALTAGALVTSSPSMGAAAGDAAREAGPNHHLLYELRRVRSESGFRPLAVTITDPFANGSFAVFRPVDLALPADKNDEGIPDPDLYYQVYAVRLSEGVSARARILVHNQFGDWTLEVREADRLFVPADADVRVFGGLGPEQEPPVANHYLCHRVDVGDGPRVGSVVVDDELPGFPRAVSVLGMRRLCAPAEKVHEEAFGVIDPDAYLACFGIRPPPFVFDRWNAFVVDQFGEWSGGGTTEHELCVPSSNLGPVGE